MMSLVTRIDAVTGTEVFINYEVVGSGNEVIVLHHGNGNRLEDYYSLGFVDNLKEKHQLILIDSRGYGKSSKLHDSKEYNLKSRADDTIAVLNQEKIDKVHCLGASVGASICFLLAKFYPERFKSYIFATPYFTLFDQDIKMALKKGTEAFVIKLEKLLNKPIEDIAIRNSFLQNDSLALIAANSSEWFNYQDYIQYIKLPSLVYVGEKETSLKEMEALAQNIKKNSGQLTQFHVFPAMDHAEVYWSGAIVAPVIAEFVDSLHRD
jgi:pimeloyl-ACP methyl ester carboxylesterase